LAIFQVRFLILYTVGRTPLMRDQLVARTLTIHKTTQTQNKCTQTSMPRVGFEPRTPVFERTKTVHALDRAATVISSGCRDPHFLHLGTSWSSVVSFTPRPLCSRRKTPCTHSIGGWVCPRTGLHEESCFSLLSVCIFLALSLFTPADTVCRY
jgi:hypothetical protein